MCLNKYRKGTLNLLWYQSVYLFVFYVHNANIYIGAKPSLYTFILIKRNTFILKKKKCYPRVAVSQLTFIDDAMNQGQTTRLTLGITQVN